MREVKEILPGFYFLPELFILFCIERLQGGNFTESYGNLFVARWNTSKNYVS